MKAVLETGNIILFALAENLEANSLSRNLVINKSFSDFVWKILSISFFRNSDRNTKQLNNFWAFLSVVLEKSDVLTSTDVTDILTNFVFVNTMFFFKKF